MLISQSKISQIVCLTGITLALDLLFFSNYWVLQAKPAKNQRTVHKGLPSNRRDGGSRGDCIPNDQNFIALVPEQSVSATASVSPQIFFYAPQTEEPKIIEFVLRNNKDQLVHETFVQTTGKSGIMNVVIPDQIKKGLGKFQGNYHWYLSMICDPRERSRDIVLEGWIEYRKLNHSLQEKINLSTFVEKINLLQQQGIWYDALSLLAQSQQLESNLTSLQAEWLRLLQSIGLEELASEPLIQGEKIHNFYSVPLTESAVTQN
ncbi:MAG: DUF928 domain-containing protein [Xenococcaceae cyanobacterium MO_188.B19]|nr:DUF928 domain-containing protein [Xenococcaceae cyanobacterium MO_188.B19]